MMGRGWDAYAGRATGFINDWVLGRFRVTAGYRMEKEGTGGLIWTLMSMGVDLGTPIVPIDTIASRSYPKIGHCHTSRKTFSLYNQSHNPQMSSSRLISIPIILSRIFLRPCRLFFVILGYHMLGFLAGGDLLVTVLRLLPGFELFA